MTIHSLHGAGTLRITNGTLEIASTTTLSHTVNLNLEGGTLQGAGTLEVSNAMSWSGGTMSGSGTTRILNGASLALGGGTKVLRSGRTLDNRGTATWTGGEINVSGGAGIVNDGTWDIATDADFPNCCGNAGAFTNIGTLVKSVGAANDSTFFSGGLELVNGGTVEVLAGTLELRDGGRGAGIYRVAANATLRQVGGTLTFDAGATVDGFADGRGAGTARLSGDATSATGGYALATVVDNGTLRVNADATIPTLTLSGGSLGGTAVLTVAGTAAADPDLSWTGGTMGTTDPITNARQGGTTRILNGASLALGGGTKVLRSGRTLDNRGAATWAGGEIYVSEGAGIVNGGTWDIATDADFPNCCGDAGAFTNTGTLVKSAGGVTFFSGGLDLVNSGTVEVRASRLDFNSGFTQTGIGSVTRLNGGNIAGGSTLNIQDGRLEGTGTIAQAVNAAPSGDVSPGLSPGQITTGSLTLGSASVMTVELGGTTPGTGYDQTVVNGTVALDGATLNVTQFNGFVPTAGVGFTIIDNRGTNQVSGTFNDLDEGDTITVGGRSLRITYRGGTGNDVVLISPGANLGITKTDGRTEAVPGTQITYTIVVTNDGPNAASGATVTDVFPAQLTNVSYTSTASGGATGNTPAGAGDINDTVNLPVGASVTYTATGTIIPSATGTLSNTAAVTAPDAAPDPDAGNNSRTDTTTLTPRADPQITIDDGRATTTRGNVLTYTIVASNPSGPSDAPASTVGVTFDPQFSAVSWTCAPAASCGTAGGSGNINQAVNLPVGGTATFTAQATVGGSAQGTLSSAATVTAANGVTDTDTTNNSRTDTTVVESADLRITKTDNATTEVPGTPVTYTIVVTNAGPDAASGAAVTDVFPAQLTNVTYTCTAGGGAAGCTAAGAGDINDTVNLPSGASVTYTATGQLNPAARGTLSNTATVTTPSDLHDPNSGNNSATDTTTVIAPSFTLTVTRQGAGSGTVTGTPPGIDCGSDCSEAFPENTQVTLTATAAAGSTFAGFSGGCSGTAPCTLTMDQNRTVTATFEPAPSAPPPPPPAANTPPTISDVPDQATPENTPIAVNFAVNDAESPAANLTVTASSSDTTLVPNGHLALGGSGANRTLTITPAAGQFGATTTTLTVQDAAGATASDTFVLTVNPTPRAPGPGPEPGPPPPSSVVPPLPALTIADARRVEGNAGTANLVFTARLSAASARPVGVAFATQDLPASNPRRARASPDYVTRRGTLTIPPGRTTGTIAVPIRGDTAVEPDERFRLVLSAPTNARLARPSVLGLILDNDGRPRLFIDDAKRAEGQAGRAPLAFTVGLTRPSRTPVTVSFATVNGTARAPGDFVAGRGTLTFPPGVVKRTILVPVVGDRVREPDEQLRVVLSRASVGLADAVGVGTILNDD